MPKRVWNEDIVAALRVKLKEKRDKNSPQFLEEAADGASRGNQLSLSHRRNLHVDAAPLRGRFWTR